MWRLLPLWLALIGCAIDFPPLNTGDASTDADGDADGDGDTDSDDPEDGGVSGCVRFVNGAASPEGDGLSWGAAFRSVQQGIDAAESGAEDGECQVWVAQGVYRVYLDGPDDTIALNPRVELYGGFAGTEQTLTERDWHTHKTVLSGCDEECLHHVYHVVTGHPNSEDDRSRIDGFVISDGRATSSATDPCGGGMYINGGAPTLANCFFIENEAELTGGGLCHQGSGVLRIESTLFMDNRAKQGGGLSSGSSSTIVLQNGVFIDNFAAELGGAVYLDRVQSAGIEQTEFSANRAESSGGALYLSSVSHAVSVTNSLLTENWAPFGGGATAHNSGMELVNTLFFSNRSDHAGAIHARGNSRVKLINCTLTENRCTVGDVGGILVEEGPEVEVTNVILWDNEPQEIAKLPSGTGTVNVAHSNVRDLDALELDGNENNIDSDPAFAVGAFAGVSWVSRYYDNATYLTEITAEESIGTDVPKRGLFINVNTADAPFSPVTDADDSRLFVWGDKLGDANPGNSFQFRDLHLTAESPCIDQGDAAAAPDQDLEGNGRQGKPDMGAFEFILSK